MIPFTYIKQSWFFFRSHFSMLARLQLPFLVLLALTSLLTASDASSDSETAASILPYLIVAAIIMPLAKAMLILYFSAALGNHQVSVGQVLSKATPYWLGLLVLGILTSLAILAGAMLFLIPGIIIAARLSIAEYIYILEGESIIESFKSSWERTGPYFWPLLNGFAFLFIAVNFSAISLEQLFGTAAWSAIIDLLAGLFSILLTIFGFRMYSLIKEKPTPSDE